MMGCGWSNETGDSGGFGDDLSESIEFQAYMDEHVIASPDGKRWLIEGDIVTSDINVVTEAYHSYQAAFDNELLGDGFRSTVACDLDLRIDQIWDPSRKLRLTYCFDSSWESVPHLQNLTVAAMDAATLAWESAADINFVAVEDGEGCSHDSALFVVAYEGDSKKNCIFGVYCPNALAFFPNEPDPAKRYIHMWDTAYDSMAKLNRIIAHELGHTLGLWHEHGRFLQGDPGCEATATIGNGNWRGVTAGDPYSVMGYPGCAQTNQALSKPSALDRTGLAFLYNLSRPIMKGALAPQDPGTLVWHKPVQGEYVVWNPRVISSDLLAFVATEHCYYPGCAAGDSPYWKPVLFRNDVSVGVQMYGPRVFEERRFRDLGGVTLSDVPASRDSSVDVPVVLDRFFNAQDRSIWWVRPGHPSDRIWYNLDGAVSSASDYDERVFTDEHYSVGLGRFLLLQPSVSSALWFSPTSNLLYLTYFQNGTVVQNAISKDSTCSLVNGVSYDMAVGDFDGNGQDGVVWYDFDTGALIYWPSVLNCGVSTAYNIGKAKIATVRLTAQPSDSLLVYRPQDQMVEFLDVPSGLAVSSHAVTADSAPILRDFDGDGCTDMLWFTPHLPTSQLWQSQCNSSSFLQTAVTPPVDSYPLGYGLGHGRP